MTRDMLNLLIALAMCYAVGAHSIHDDHHRCGETQEAAKGPDLTDEPLTIIPMLGPLPGPSPSQGSGLPWAGPQLKVFMPPLKPTTR